MRSLEQEEGGAGGAGAARRVNEGVEFFVFYRSENRKFPGQVVHESIFAFYDTLRFRIVSTLPVIPESIRSMIQQLLCPGRGAVFIRRAHYALIYEDIQS